MMKKDLFIVSILFCTSAGFGQNLDNAAVHRIGDYGKLWSVINLFHPEMAYNKINADSLFTDNISRLIKDPSAANFKVAVSKMLGSLHDPYTTINDNHNKIKDTAELPDRQLIKWLSDSIAMVYFNDDFIRQNYSDFGNDTALSHLINTIKNANGIIIDLRKASRNDENKSYYEGGFMKNLISYLIEHDLSYPSYRSIVHYGHESETFDMSSFYFQGWITLNAPVVSKHRNAIHKPVCILINRFNDDIADAVAALQQGGIAKVVADGSLGNFEPVSTYSLQLSDSIKVNMRLMEIIYSNGCKKFSPDTSVNKLLYKSEDSLIHTAISFLKSGNEIKAPCVESLQNIFVNSTVNGYDSIAYPPASLRLLGLMRYWSAINYFCPNKDRLLKNWDSVLYEYAPKFLQAKDSFDYTLVVAKLITEIHDGHGRLDSKVWSSHYQKIPLVQLKYVEGKTIVYKTFIDSLKNILSPGDEIIKVDDVDIHKIRSWFAQYIGASDNAALQRDITEYVLAGPDSSKVKITFLHSGSVKKLYLKKNTGIHTYSFGAGMPAQARNWKKLNDKTGYVDFGKLEVPEIDSMFNDLKNTDAIIIDDRSYPRGTAWTLVNYLTDKQVTAAKGTTMIADSPDPLTETVQNSLWQLPVTPAFQYKGKIIILVNEITQSQAEYSCMIIQAAFKKTTIIGSQTAGADGDVTGIKLPGGIRTAFSGHGIYYPDGRPTQGIGIVPDIKISPTIKGIKSGRDEVLERAIQFAATGK